LTCSAMTCCVRSNGNRRASRCSRPRH
jgi:hypothetical protein